MQTSHCLSYAPADEASHCAVIAAKIIFSAIAWEVNKQVTTARHSQKFVAIPPLVATLAAAHNILGLSWHAATPFSMPFDISKLVCC